MPEDEALMQKALELGIITEREAERAHELEESLLQRGMGVCPFWTGSAATMIAQGWDADADWYEDYEHPVGWNHDIVCMTAFYYGWTGGAGPAHEFHFDYKPNIARHRLKVGLSGTPSWFAAAQTTMRWQ